ncbi:hypothetical protein [Cellvibrio japonicus]|uniref:FagA protein n=1 Tax=Cellvibrio japonicus (strain Ueda107) TaxID=498211 RepID=B3PJT9_CELJU|nr:hypothetical protein [Cellvibrio japonicus]ACE82913.1 fagA protein [Cellvibrio japonicus Ueda107]QEI12722.1 hypothetical protein FY117_11130 [Cellvibrio japonicus]QEI16296.1 hypothetical protein FY116_11135 [Cellvibrio japonicus]QEI19874.1 hypothetical protein FY115_11130 [Cellvibrio japonicus]
MQPQTNPVSHAELVHIRRKIRWGEEPDNSLLISRWLAQENQDLESTREELRQRYKTQFTLLMETIVDELVPAHWRCLCLDNIHRPLQSLKQISDSSQSEGQIRQLTRELAIQSYYVRHSLRF